ncbi:MAG: ParB/RepB/Spo0J family partition protein [Gemmatimonadetes bacterium]|nr:ParB/RepB/Spo0J family partition protein [Gemmatimonadota bacterium]
MAEARAEGSLTQLPLAAIRPNPYQPRHVFDEGALEELKESLKASGLLQPIIVRPAAGGTFELIAGERRWRAAERLGWKDIGAVVREVDDRTLLTLALVENLQRDALSPIDEARGYQRLVVEFSVSQNELGGMVGRERSTVANALRLLKLPEDVQELVHGGQLSTGHARALLQLKDGEEMGRLARQTVEQGLSVRELEALVRGDRQPQRRARGGTRTPRVRQAGPDVRRVEEALRHRLRTDVFLTPRGKGGRVSITFYSNEDLARLLHIILGEPFEG